MQFSKLFKIITVVTAVLALIFFILYKTYLTTLWFSLTMTFGTIFYHFAMRLTVGTVADRIFRNGINTQSSWFREKPFERKLYKLLRVKEWKRFVPTWDSQKFSLEQNDAQKIIENMCSAEVIHEIIVLLGYASLLFCFLTPDPKGDIAVFAITAFFAGLCDTFFVILQRYNRPRMIRFLARYGQNFEK